MNTNKELTYKEKFAKENNKVTCSKCNRLIMYWPNKENAVPSYEEECDRCKEHNSTNTFLSIIPILFNIIFKKRRKNER